MTTSAREGNLKAPIRHPLDWKNPQFYDNDNLLTELERIYDLCHGCRRCVNLCNTFPTLFDLVDESETMEVDGVDKKDYWKIVDHCYLCDLCYQTKCPYITPHVWNIDFPHLMLRAKAVMFKQGKVKLSEKILSATDATGSLASIPVVTNVVNAVNRSKPMRKMLDKTLGVHPQARVPNYHSSTLRKREKTRALTDGDQSNGKVALFTTCYGNYNEPDLGEDMIAVLSHNGIKVILVEKEQCCGMPKLELGDLQAVEHAKQANIPQLAKLVDEGWDLMALVPSCVLMFKQELPLMFPDDKRVRRVADAFFDPFEYLIALHKDARLNTDFKHSLGTIAYHVACHQRVQLIGMKTRELLELIPDTTVKAIERCSGHDGTYGVKTLFYPSAKKIARPVVNRVKQAEADHYGSDCPMAGRFIEHEINDGTRSGHPVSLLRKAYGI